nr:urease subunit beta [Actinoplanes sp. M2I2]
MTIPGEILFGDGDIEINPGRELLSMTVRNTGDRPVQVGSHFHFAESNTALEFDRRAAWGHRLAVPAGTSVRFEPGMPRDVSLVALAGARIVPGLRGLAGGPLDSTGPLTPPPHEDDGDPPNTRPRENSGPGDDTGFHGDTAGRGDTGSRGENAPRGENGGTREQPENGSPR